MKHIELFEAKSNTTLSLNRYDILHKDYMRLFKNLKYYFEYLIDMLDGEKETKIDLDNIEWSYTDADGHWSSEFSSIDTQNGEIISISESVFQFDDFSTESKFAIVEVLQAYVQTSYKYQKDLILNHPERIHEIIEHLNPRIKKEYKHLVSGSDLGLLK